MTDSYNTFPYQQVIFKASHNSYDRSESIAQQLTFDPNATYQCGCRGVEFDLHRHSGGSISVGQIKSGFWTVNHLTTGGPDFSTYLSQLIDWHNGTGTGLDNTNHDPVWVTLDVKSSNGGYDTFPQELDNYLLTYFGRNLIMAVSDLFPGFTGENNQKLSTVAAANGWPLVADMRGKFIFCISGNSDDWKNQYYKTDLKNRLCLVDSNDVSDLDHANSRVVYNLSAGGGNQSDFTKLENLNIVIRVYDIESSKDWSKATTMGGSVLATNQVSGSTWACVSSSAPFSGRTPH